MYKDTTKRKRNEMILKLKSQGWTFKNIAQKYKISDVRAFQIYTKQKTKKA